MNKELKIFRELVTKVNKNKLDITDEEVRLVIAKYNFFIIENFLYNRFLESYVNFIDLKKFLNNYSLIDYKDSNNFIISEVMSINETLEKSVKDHIFPKIRNKENLTDSEMMDLIIYNLDNIVINLCLHKWDLVDNYLNKSKLYLANVNSEKLKKFRDIFFNR